MLPKKIFIITATHDEVANEVGFAERMKTALGDHDLELVSIDHNSADGTNCKPLISAC